MKKHLSVLMLFVRSTFYKILGILVLMCGLEFLLFSHAVSKSRADSIAGLEYAIEKSWLGIVFLLTLLAVFLLLVPTGSLRKSKYVYTLNRLRISENWIFFWQSFYNILVFFLILSVQIAAAFLFCSYYTENSGDQTITHQTVFLAFYRSDFLHSLIPFDEPHAAIGNSIVLIMLGLASALIPALERQGRKGGGFFLYLSWWCAVNAFRRNLAGFGINLMIYIFAAVFVIYTIWFLLAKEVRHDI